MRHHIRKLTLLLAVFAALAVAGPAFAASGDDAYKNSGENVAGNLQGPDQGGGGPAGDTAGTDVSAGTGGALPFTGLDLALIFGVGGLLTAVGLGMRRLTRHADAA
jgi:hypothetical protein